MSLPRRKWLVLAVFALTAGLSQFLWLNLAPLISLIQHKYSVTESVAGIPLLVFPAVYVLLSVHAGSLIDRRGYRFAIVVGTALMAGFACLRVVDTSFALLVIAQTGISIGQPYVVNGISKLVLDWFDHEDEAIATGIGTAGMFIGMAVGMAASSPLVERLGYPGAMGVIGLVSLGIFAAVWLVIHPNSACEGRMAGPPEAIGAHLGALLRDRDLLLIFVMAFLGLGYINGLMTWIEPILRATGFDSGQAGLVGGVLGVGGIVGSAIIPGLSDRFRRRKPFLVACILAALATIYPLCRGGDFGTALALGALHGFLFLPGYALLLAMAAEAAGSRRSGAATGVLMLTGNVGAVLVIMAMQWVKSDITGFGPSIHLMAVLLAGGAALAFVVGETYSRQK